VLTKNRIGRFPIFFKKEIKMADIFTAVDLSSVAAFVGATGVVIIGITMGFKGINLGKRGIKQA
jgi:hypothetical protein